MTRVVVTGIGLASPIGHDLDTISKALQSDVSGVRHMPDFDKVGQLSTRVAAEIRDLDLSIWPRKKVRSMGRVSLLATYATEQAVKAAGLDEELLRSGRVGLAYGSTHGSTESTEFFTRKLFLNESLKGVPSTSYLKFMSHTCAANIAQFYGIRGRIITTCAACVSASQAIGYAYEAVKSGAQEVMLAGGAEEMHVTHAGVFDIMYATSTKFNDRPELTPRPFDKRRDGLVVGEGAGTFVLESYERAKARGAHIFAEIIGFGTNCDGTHVTSPSVEGMAGAMGLALKDAGIGTEDIGYINAHATATDVGDVCESRATHGVFGDKTPISSTKGFTGHTLGACGAIEASFCIAMMRDGFIAHNRNLEEVDPECSMLEFVRDEPRPAKLDIAMSNNFAFGGINTSLILKRV